LHAGLNYSQFSQNGQYGYFIGFNFYMLIFESTKTASFIYMLILESTKPQIKAQLLARSASPAKFDQNANGWNF